MKRLLNNFISKNYPMFYREQFRTLKILKDNKNIFSYLFEYNDSSVIFSIRDEIYNVHGTLKEEILFPLFNSEQIPSKILNMHKNLINKTSISFEKSFYKNYKKDTKNSDFYSIDNSLLYYFNINGDLIKDITISFNRNSSNIYFAFSDNNYYETQIMNKPLLDDIELNLYEIFIESLKIKKEDIHNLKTMALNTIGNEKDNIKKIDKFYSNKDIVSLIEILKL